MNAAIHIEQLTIAYQQRAGTTKTITRRLDTIVEGATLTALMGRNGTGKSTLIRVIAGLQEPQEGRVRIAGEDVAGMSPQRRARHISIVLPHRPEATYLTVRELVEMGRHPYTGYFGTLTDDDRLIVDEAISRMHLEALASTPVDTLSDGEAQKAAIAKALAQQTPVILLDEPTAFLDYESRQELMELLRMLAHDEGRTILLSTHDVELAHRYADRCLRMEELCPPN
jgi:iron complex transport system ATP-binding protein